MKKYNVKYNDSIGTVKYNHGLGVFTKSVRPTFIFYKETEDSREYKRKSVEFPLYPVNIEDLLQAEEHFSFLKFTGVNAEDILQAQEHFSFILADASTQVLRDTLQAQEHFSFNHSLANNQSVSDLFTGKEHFSFVLEEAGEVTVSDIFTGKELFSFSLIETVEEDVSDVLQAQEAFSYSHFTPLSLNRTDTLKADEHFSFSLNVTNEEQTADVLQAQETFSFVLGNASEESVSDVMQANESFSFENIIHITAPQNFTVTPNSGTCRMEMSWNHPTSGQPDQYRIYRGGILIETLPGSTTFFEYEELQQGVTITYSITAMVDGQEGPSASDSASLIC